MEIKLVSPSIEYKDSFLRGLALLTAQSERSAWVYLGDTADLTIPAQDFESYVNTLHLRQTKQIDKFVCDTTYWAIINNDVVGRISIRHELNDFLKKIGGHIGYITHPAWRGRGIATKMLKEILKTERARSIGKLLLTCDEGNIASEKTILKNSGKYTELVTLENRPAKKHFWIEL